ncbi:hypothetical protein pb186bvf_011440 [Paramecium bursaria]
MSKRRQFPVGGNLFEEDKQQSILGDPQWTVNYSINVKSKPDVQHKIEESEPNQDITDQQSVYKEFIQSVNGQIEKIPKEQPLSKAQQLIQQSQALIQRRRKDPNDVHIQDQNEKKNQEANAIQPQQISQIVIQKVENELQDNNKQELIQNQQVPIDKIIKQPISIGEQIKVEQKFENQSSNKINPQIQQVQIQQPESPIKVNKIIDQQLKLQDNRSNGQKIQHEFELDFILLKGFIKQNQTTQIKLQGNNALLENYPGPIISKLNKQQLQDHLRQLQYFWQQQQKSPIIQLAVEFFDKNIYQYEKNISLRKLEQYILEDSLGKQFIEVYDEILNSSDWETKLFILLIKSEYINIGQQQYLLDYIGQRQYKHNQERLLFMMVLLLKMEQSNLKDDLLQDILNFDHYRMIIYRLIWISLKMYPQFTQQTVNDFYMSFFGKINFELCSSELQILLGDTLAAHQNLTNPQLYFKFAQLFLDNQQYQKAFDCLRVALESDFQPAKDLRDRLIQIIDLQQAQKTQQSSFLGYFKSFNKKQDEAPPVKQQEQKQNFYYDKDQKGWVINGVLQKQEHDFGPQPVQQQSIAPPPQQPIQRAVSKPAPPPPQLQDDPIDNDNQFSAKDQVQEIRQNRAKKDNLLRNRYKM